MAVAWTVINKWSRKSQESKVNEKKMEGVKSYSSGLRFCFFNLRTESSHTMVTAQDYLASQ